MLYYFFEKLKWNFNFLKVKTPQLCVEMSQLHVMFQKSLMKNGKASKLFGKMCGNVSNLCVVLKTFIEKTETKF